VYAKYQVQHGPCVNGHWPIRPTTHRPIACSDWLIRHSLSFSSQCLYAVFLYFFRNLVLCFEIHARRYVIKKTFAVLVRLPAGWGIGLLVLWPPSWPISDWIWRSCLELCVHKFDHFFLNARISSGSVSVMSCNFSHIRGSLNRIEGGLTADGNLEDPPSISDCRHQVNR